MKKEAGKPKQSRRTPAGSIKADESLRAYTTSAKTAIDPRIAVAEALSATTDRVSIGVDQNRIATITPGNLLQLTFASPKVALDNHQMLVFLRNLAALFDSRTAARTVAGSRLPSARFGSGWVRQSAMRAAPATS